MRLWLHSAFFWWMTKFPNKRRWERNQNYMSIGWKKWSKNERKIKRKEWFTKKMQKETNDWSLNRKKTGSAGSQMNWPATVRGGGSISHHQRRLCYLNRWYEPNTSRSLDIWLRSVSATWDTECRWDASNIGMRLWWRCCWDKKLTPIIWSQEFEYKLYLVFRIFLIRLVSVFVSWSLIRWLKETTAYQIVEYFRS